MTQKKIKANLFIFLIFTLAFIFYFYFINKNQGSINIESTEFSKNKQINNRINKGITKFTNVEYNSSDKKGRNYTTTGKEAFVSINNPNLIEMISVHSFSTLKDGTVLNIKSKKANYFKDTRNIKYYDKVIITNKDGVITAGIAIFNANKNKIRLERNVIFKDTKNIIKGDIAELDTYTNNIQIFMKNKKNKVYGKREQ